MATNVLQNAGTAVDDLRKEVSNISSMVADAVNNGVRTALRAIDEGRESAEEAIYEAERAARQNPLRTIGIAFAAGAAVCGIAVWIGSRGR